MFLGSQFSEALTGIAKRRLGLKLRDHRFDLRFCLAVALTEALTFFFENGLTTAFEPFSLGEVVGLCSFERALLGLEKYQGFFQPLPFC